MVKLPLLQKFVVHDLPQFPDIELPKQAASGQFCRHFLRAVNHRDGKIGTIASGNGKRISHDTFNMVGLSQHLESFSYSDDLRVVPGHEIEWRTNTVWVLGQFVAACQITCHRSKRGDAVHRVATLNYTGHSAKEFGCQPHLGGHSFQVEPGSLTPFSLLCDTKGRVNVVIDASLMAAAQLNFHPLVNTESTGIAPAALLAFMQACEHTPRIVDFDAMTEA